MAKRLKYLTPKNEKNLIINEKYLEVIGIDEVGRGCLAGPVYVAGYLYSLNTSAVSGINDSKLLTKAAREKVFEKIKEHLFHIEIGSVEEIDQIGIGKTIEKLISNIINFFKSNNKDGRNQIYIIDGQFSKDFGTNSRKIIKADSTFYSVAAASIIAKVSRDRYMIELSEKYPQYELAKHKGYATRLHRVILEEIGQSEIHRMSFILKNRVSF